MKNKLLEEFKLKFDLEDEFMNIVESLFEKLISFGYVSKRKCNRLIQKLNENVLYLFFGKDETHDYKSGFYDADKKTLYLQNKNNVPAIYLRLLYAITSSEIDIHTHNMGFSTTYMLSTSYKLTERNFALNRAVIANLVCRLTNTIDTNIRLVPGYKTYTHNFFGYEILADNDIYAFEGRILSEMCFSTGIDEEIFYSYLFSKSPVNAMNKMFDRTKFIDKITFLTLFDNTSRKYSTYCKLNYFSTLLNKIYIESKKQNLNEQEVKKLEETKDKLLQNIKKIIYLLNSKNDIVDDESLFDLEYSLSSALETLEKEILENTILMQEILSNNIITGVSYLSPYLYANKLKEFSSLVIMPNKKLDDAIYNTIIFKLIPDHEISVTNIIQKIRYSLISNILETKKLTNVSNKIIFYKVETEISKNNSEVAILTVNNIFAGLVNILDIDKDMSNLKNNTTNIKSVNLKQFLHDKSLNNNTEKIQIIISNLKAYFINLKKISLDNIYIFNMLDVEFILVNTNNTVFLFKINEETKLEPVPISCGFSLFDLKKKTKQISTLPTIYKEKSKIFNLFRI